MVMKENATVVQVKLYQTFEVKNKNYEKWVTMDYVYASLEAAKAFWAEFIEGEFTPNADYLVANLKKGNAFKASAVILKLAEVK